jgi:integrase
MTRYVRGVSIYKPKARSRRTDPYILAWKDANGQRRTRTASTDLRIAIQLANEIALRNDAAVLGLIDPNTDRHAAANQKPIDKHADDFREWLIARGATGHYARETSRLVLRVMNAARISRITDINPGDVQRAIKALPRQRVAEGTLSNRQLDKAVRACKRFGAYLRKSNYVAVHPLIDLAHYDAEADRRRVRRAVDPDDVIALIDAADRGPVLAGMPGSERAQLYRCATATGLRFGSLVSLVPESFVLNSPAPFVRVTARFMKNRKTRELPLRADLVELLKPWLATKRIGQPVFAKKRGAKFMDAFRSDLKAAGIAYRDDAGHFFDFHAQRNQFITAVVRSAGLKAAQDLAGHSTPLLTARYARLNYDDYRKALDGLPALAKQHKPKGKSGGVA